MDHQEVNKGDHQEASKGDHKEVSPADSNISELITNLIPISIYKHRYFIKYEGALPIFAIQLQ